MRSSAKWKNGGKAISATLVFLLAWLGTIDADAHCPNTDGQCLSVEAARQCYACLQEQDELHKAARELEAERNTFAGRLAECRVTVESQSVQVERLQRDVGRADRLVSPWVAYGGYALAVVLGAGWTWSMVR